MPGEEMSSSKLQTIKKRAILICKSYWYFLLFFSLFYYVWPLLIKIIPSIFFSHSLFIYPKPSLQDKVNQKSDKNI